MKKVYLVILLALIAQKGHTADFSVDLIPVSHLTVLIRDYLTPAFESK